MIRMAKIENFSGFLKVFREAQDLHAMNEPNIFKFADPVDLNGFVEMLMTDNVRVLVSETGNVITGILVGVITEKESNLTFFRKIFAIENLAVLKSEQKKHIGEKLMCKAYELAKKEKCDSLNLNVWCFNENAHAFYKHLGFVDKIYKYAIGFIKFM